MRRLSSAFRTYKGINSGSHDDSFLCQDNLFIVAEGLGGQYLNGIAKETACRVIYQSFFDHLSKVHSPREALIFALKEANKDIIRKRKKAGKKMGASVSVAYIRDQIMYFTHLGDSRIYSLYKEEINQLTRDHIVEEERPLPESAVPGERRHLKALTEGLGLHEKPDIEVKKYALREKDLILMTTEGLTKNVSDREILRLSSKPKTLNRLCDELIDSATRGNWEGNVTAGLLRIEKYHVLKGKKVLLYSGIVAIILVVLGLALFFLDMPKGKEAITLNRSEAPAKTSKTSPSSLKGAAATGSEPSAEGSADQKSARAPARNTAKTPEPGGRQVSATEHVKEVKPISMDGVGVEDEIMAFLDQWKVAWQNTAGPNGDKETYLSFYSESFLSKGMDKKVWGRDKARINRKKRWIKINLTRIQISESEPGKPIEVRFFQDYSSSNYSSRSRKLLALEMEADGWRIIREESS